MTDNAENGARVVADLDNGYLRLATEIQKAKCKLRVSPREWQVLEAVILLTYGWNKSADRVTNTCLAEITEIDASNVSKALRALADRRVVLMEQRGHSKIVSINKVISEWVLREPPRTDGKNLVRTDANLVRTDANLVRTDANLVNSDLIGENLNNLVNSDANQVNSDEKNLVNSDANLVRTDANLVRTDLHHKQVRINTERQKTEIQKAAASQLAVRGDNLTMDAKRVIAEMNAILGSRYPAKADGQTCKAIRARMAEGMTPQDLKLVIEFKQCEWGSDPAMAQYLRPSTLFRESNAHGYLQAARLWDSNGRKPKPPRAATSAELNASLNSTAWADVPADQWW